MIFKLDRFKEKDTISKYLMLDDMVLNDNALKKHTLGLLSIFLCLVS